MFGNELLRRLRTTRSCRRERYFGMTARGGDVALRLTESRAERVFLNASRLADIAIIAVSSRASARATYPTGFRCQGIGAGSDGQSFGLLPCIPTSQNQNGSRPRRYSAILSALRVS